MPKTDPERLAGLILGTAVGDALGLPAEGLRPATIKKLRWSDNWRHRLLPGRGMWSDDTEHTIMLGQALARSEGDPEVFAKAMAWELRWWLLGLPAGVGLATVRALVKLWLGFSPKRSGVFSAGNGPCMRAALVGACYPNDHDKRHLLTEAHTRLTHSDPKAFTAARAVAELAAILSTADEAPDVKTVMDAIDYDDADADWKSIVSAIHEATRNGDSLEQFLKAIGIEPRRGISGYAYHTVPVVIFLGIKNGWDFVPTLTQVINAGGDADSTGAIAGALCGAFSGRDAIPNSWMHGIHEWPVGIRGLEELAFSLAEDRKLRVRAYWSPALLLRNLFFLAVVLTHGFLRLVPTRLRRASTQ